MFKHLFVTLTVAAALTTACKATDVNTNAGPNPRDAATAGDASRATAATAPETAALSVEDRQFVQKAAEGGREEVELGRLAQQHGSSDVVKRLGQRIADDHERANREFKSLLGSSDIAQTAAADKDGERIRLEKLSGPSFDRSYVELMIDDHQKDIAEFERAMHSTNPAVRDFAEKTLPTLREHLVQAREAEAGLKK
jgi:putative membrane protein